MPYTYRVECVASVSQDMSQVCYTRHVTSVSQDVLQACKTPFIPHVSPNSVHSWKEGDILSFQMIPCL